MEGNNGRRKIFIGLAAGILLCGVLVVFVFGSGYAENLSVFPEALRNAVRDTFKSASGKGHLVAEIPLDAERGGLKSVPFDAGIDKGNIPEAAIAGKNNTATFAEKENIPESVESSRLVIAEVQIAGASSSNDIVKLYNPGSASVDIGNWKLRKRTQSGNEYSVRVFPVGSVIPAESYFTWANSGNGYALSVKADVSSGETLAANNSIALEDPSGSIIDALAWGAGHVNPFIEGSVYPANPEVNQVLARKLIGDSIVDTGNNAADFIVR
ncbi:MAG: lamin tail domain-containing protein [bacterium]|nr:lamin tail domain-containing protein [bacterium]